MRVRQETVFYEKICLCKDSWIKQSFWSQGKKEVKYEILDKVILWLTNLGIQRWKGFVTLLVLMEKCFQFYPKKSFTNGDLWNFLIIFPGLCSHAGNRRLSPQNPWWNLIKGSRSHWKQKNNNKKNLLLFLLFKNTKLIGTSTFLLR